MQSVGLFVFPFGWMKSRGARVDTPLKAQGIHTFLSQFGLIKLTRARSWFNKKDSYKVNFCLYHSLSFCICSALQTIFHSLFYFALQDSLPIPTCLSSLADRPLLSLFCHFIMLLLNILLPIAPKELVCYNMKIWPHLVEVMGNKHLTRGWTNGSSNSNLLLAPSWLVVLPGSARFPLPVVSYSPKSGAHFISMPTPPSPHQHQIYWYWPFAEIKRADPWAVRAKFKPIKEHFTNQQGKAGAVSQTGLLKLKSFALYQNLFTGQTVPK